MSSVEQDICDFKADIAKYTAERDQTKDEETRRMLLEIIFESHKAIGILRAKLLSDSEQQHRSGTTTLSLLFLTLS